MKSPPGLNYVTGPMGAGKSFFGIRQIIENIMGGRYCLTNVALKPGWAERAARHYPPTLISWILWRLTPGDFFGKKYRNTVRFYESLYIYESDLLKAMKYRFPGKKEGRVAFVWDESHNDLNNRNWNSTTVKGTRKNEVTGADDEITEKDLRDLILKWVTQFRKLGFTGFFISQHSGNTDAMLRRVCNTEIRLLNQRNNIRVLGMRICPIPFFIAIHVPANTPKVAKGSNVIHVDRYFLSWHKKTYDTLGLFHNIEEHIDTDAIWLPAPGEYHPDVRPADVVVSPVQPQPPTYPVPATATTAGTGKSRKRKPTAVKIITAPSPSNPGATGV